MPKVDIDYSNTVFYKISCKDESISDVYIGHTTNFVQRKSGHKQSCNNSKSANYSCKLYEFIRQNGGWNNWRMDIIAYQECNDHYEARKKEQELFILHKATLNSIEPMPKPKSKIARPTVHTNDVKSTHTCETCNFSCFNTLEVFTQHLSRNKHIKAATNVNPYNNYSKYSCTKCDFITRNKKDFKRHLTTTKHTNSNYIEQNVNNIPSSVSCAVCQKRYISRSGMWYHQKKCKGPEPEKLDVQSTTVKFTDETINQMFGLVCKKLSELSDQSSLVIELGKQNSELKTFILEQNKFMMELVNKSNITSTTV